MSLLKPKSSFLVGNEKREKKEKKNEVIFLYFNVWIFAVQKKKKRKNFPYIFSYGKVTPQVNKCICVISRKPFSDIK